MPFFLFYLKEVKLGALAILILTLPFIIDQTLMLHTDHTGGAQGLIISVNGILVIALLFIRHLEVKMNRERPFNLFFSKSIFYWGLMGMGLLSMINALNPAFSLFELLEFFKMYLIFLLIANTVHHPKNRHWILMFILIGLFLESSIAVLQYVTGSTLGLKVLGGRAEADISRIGADAVYRVSGTLGGVNELALYFNFMMPLPFALVLSGIHWRYRFLALGIFILGSMGLFFTYSRAGWLCYALSLAIVFFLRLLAANLKFRTYLMVIIVLVFGIAGSVILGTNNPIRNRLTADDKGSAYVRIPLMQVAFNMIQAHPVLGVGLNNYCEVHTRYDDTTENVTSHFPLPVHNMYLQLTAETGIPSLLILLGLLFSIYVSAFYLMRSTRKLDYYVILGIVGGLTGFLIHGLVENGSLGHFSMMSLWVFAGWIFGLERSVKLNASAG